MLKIQQLIEVTSRYLGALSAVGMLGVGATTPAIAASALASPAAESSSDTAIAQLFYPPADGPRIVAVTGQGRASVTADTAQLLFAFTNQDSDPYDYAIPYPAEEAPPPETLPEPVPITRDSLQAAVAALTALGISAEDIEIVTDPLELGRYRVFGDASLSLDIRQPTPERVAEIQEAVGNAFSNNPNVFVQDFYVQYAIDSCETLENEAYASAIADARLRADAIAAATGVELADPPSVAELPFFGRFYSPCSSEPNIVDQISGGFGGRSYSSQSESEVVIYREVAVTYRIR
ncbi:MAG: SIMPL domain-containing protein [Leptolyngbyaceae cyanobacterium SM1_1_3]|nr:SIMPL domain-containing protein [Leptolyngbyaceae cyanobacterium SM1_1_3]NJN02723.1 SIMPL domain-containing protein [Leptolyngbyaceae cyanobacterium RM1_1_2]NJO10984.1 SIMPL domain-containing protein [Leptolyngbyaceae cyanobacterium SL_1_1]